MNSKLGFYKYFYEGSFYIGFFHGEKFIDNKEFLNVYNFDIMLNNDQDKHDNHYDCDDNVNDNDSEDNNLNDLNPRIEYLPLVALNKTNLIRIENNIYLQQIKVVIIFTDLFISGQYQYRDGMRNVYGLNKIISYDGKEEELTDFNFFGFIPANQKIMLHQILKMQHYEYCFRQLLVGTIQNFLKDNRGKSFNMIIKLAFVHEDLFNTLYESTGSFKSPLLNKIGKSFENFKFILKSH